MSTQLLIPAIEQHTYHELQHQINLLLCKRGLPQALRILKAVTGERDILDVLPAKAVESFILREASKAFGLKRADLLTKEGADYRLGRMACMHLLATYCLYTHEHIAEMMQVTRRSVSYYIQRSEEHQAHPTFHQEYIRPYQSIERALIQHINQKIKEQSC